MKWAAASLEHQQCTMNIEIGFRIEKRTRWKIDFIEIWGEHTGEFTVASCNGDYLVEIITSGHFVRRKRGGTHLVELPTIRAASKWIISS